MHLHPDPARLCVIGDSQMGSLRKADDAGLIAWPEDMQIEYWGAAGPSFRKLRWKDGGLEATGDAIESVSRINANKRTRIAPSDFDTLVFYGARLRLSEFFAPMLQWRADQGGWPSRQVLKLAANRFAVKVRAFRNARAFAEAGTQVIFVPSPFYTDGIVNMAQRKRVFARFPAASSASAEDRARLWLSLDDAFSDAGVSLVTQPDDTVVSGVLTDPSFAREGAKETGDFGHKNETFAARMMEGALSLIAQSSRAA